MKTKLSLQSSEIEQDNYHLFVKARVNGVKARLLLDTGASKTVFDEKAVLRFVKQSRIRQEETRSVGLGTNDAETQTVILKKLRLGKIKIRKTQVAILDISHVNESYSQLGLKGIDGVLGSDLLMKYSALIDYRRKTLQLEI